MINLALDKPYGSEPMSVQNRFDTFYVEFPEDYLSDVSEVSQSVHEFLINQEFLHCWYSIPCCNLNTMFEWSSYPFIAEEEFSKVNIELNWTNYQNVIIWDKLKNVEISLDSFLLRTYGHIYHLWTSIPLDIQQLLKEVK